MNRRKFVKRTALLGAIGISGMACADGLGLFASAPHPLAYPDMQIKTLTIDNQGHAMKIHAIPTGTVKVKRSHKTLRPPAALRFPRLLMERNWTEALPIYTWVIEHPEGIILIDTGENSRTNEPGYFDCDSIGGNINSTILRFDVQPEQEIAAQLARLSIQPDQVRWVVLTHLHLDHVDGLSSFEQSEIVLSRTEWQRPYGAMTCLLPDWFSPRLIDYPNNSHPIFAGAYPLTQAGDVWLIPTPGHTHGHQSVLLQLADMTICIAGDAAFSEQQLLDQEYAGICVDLAATKDSYGRLRQMIQTQPTVFLPSHDPLSGERLMGQKITQM